MPFLIAWMAKDLEASSLVLVHPSPNSGVKGDETGSMLETSPADKLRELKNPCIAYQDPRKKMCPKFFLKKIAFEYQSCGRAKHINRSS